MAVAVRSVRTVVNNGGSLTLDVTKPDGTVADDVLVLLSYQHDGANPDQQWPAGFDEIGRISNLGGNFMAGAAWKLAGDTEPASYTITNGNGQSGTDQFVGLVALVGADPVTPVSGFDIRAIGQPGGTLDLPSNGVAGVADGLVISGWFVKADSPGLGTITPPVSMTTRGQGQTSVGAGGYSLGAWATEGLLSSGDTGERHATTTKNPDGYHAAFTIAVAPAPVVAGDPAETRVFTVPDRVPSFVVPGEPRSFVVPSQSRTVRIPS